MKFTPISTRFVGSLMGGDFEGMARGIGRLSAVALPKLKAGMHPDGGGLYLQVTKGGARTWIYRFMLHGRAREMGLGPLHIVTLAEAREKAREARKLRHEGLNVRTRRARHRHHQKHAEMPHKRPSAAEPQPEGGDLMTLYFEGFNARMTPRYICCACRKPILEDTMPLREWTRRLGA